MGNKQYKSILITTTLAVFVWFLEEVCRIILEHVIPKYYQKHHLISYAQVISILLLAAGIYILYHLYIVRKKINSTFSFIGDTEKLELSYIGQNKQGLVTEEDKSLNEDIRPYYGYLEREFYRTDAWDFASKEEVSVTYKTDEIIELLYEKDGVRKFLLVGSDWEGKTCAIFNFVRKIPNSYLLLAENGPNKDVNIVSSIKIPKNKKVIVWFDDVSKFHGFEIKTVFKQLESMKNELLIFGTCTNDFYQFSINDQNLEFFKSQTLCFGLVPISISQKFKLAELSKNVKLTDVNQWKYVTPGDITMEDLVERKRKYYEKISHNPFLVSYLRAIKLLSKARVTITFNIIYDVMTEIFNVRGITLRDLSKSLKEISPFIYGHQDGKIIPLPIYLERVVQYSSGVNEDDELDNLHKLLKSKINTEEGKKREDYLNALNELSQGFRFLENYQKELRCVEDVLEKNENDWFANYIKSFVLGLQGEIYQAEIFNTKSLKKNPEFAEAWDHKCYLLTKIGDYEAALEAADNAIRLKGFDDSYTHKAIALLCLERYKEAEDTLNIACLISPHDYYPYYSFGKALYWNEKYIEAIMYLDRSLEKRNNFYGSYYYLSLVYKKIGNWEESEKNAILCLKFGNENNATAQCLLGEIYNGKKQYEDAVKQLEKAILLKGGWFPFGYLMLGITYYNWAKSLESEDVETIEKQITYLEASVKGFSDSISTKIDDLESAKRKKERSLLMLRGRKMILNQKI